MTDPEAALRAALTLEWAQLTIFSVLGVEVPLNSPSTRCLIESTVLSVAPLLTPRAWQPMDEATFVAFGEYLIHHGAVHDGACPGDDTCECSGKRLNDAANSVYKFLAGLPPAPKERKG